jgi:DNA-binding HxlR family transcriptional regulator
MKRKSFAQADCPIARALSVVGDLWSILIVREAMTGVRRFNEFATRLGMAKNILADRLKKLVACGVLESVPASDGSAYNEYALTPKGQDLFTILVALRQWTERWVPEAHEWSQILVDRERGEPVGNLQLPASDGRTLTLRDVAMQPRIRESVA